MKDSQAHREVPRNEIKTFFYSNLFEFFTITDLHCMDSLKLNRKNCDVYKVAANIIGGALAVLSVVR